MTIRWPHLIMCVSVMDVGVVHVRVRQRRMMMMVRVRFRVRHWRIVWPMHVLVVFVMNMWMGVIHRLVCVLMFVSLGQVQPHACRHQSRRSEKATGDRFAEHHNRDRGADERRGREVGAGACGANVAQRQDEQHETDAVS